MTALSAFAGSKGYAVPADAVFPPFCANRKGPQRSGVPIVPRPPKIEAGVSMPIGNRMKKLKA